eukprot:Plantae.Rhodophyta-Purpureofilum_apyrenoidigerum.ctg711.p1 GENE.Plantae.Rhodophyta-Purpureofilum_apyrenoidigerum.ctg711~~Plantae.Rhodophyta-Purpureofilum_apyrenoidigerum.ctg711.p1  ORF type:complete len:358 (-),score=70.21 Plantae.Rhodophyta-Purpureofilum_apyrenoidigerum.ctg711:61-1134(-)
MAEEQPQRVKQAGDCQDFLAEVVGEESLAGKHMSTSALLDMMDLVAGRIAISFAECPCTTVSFDRVDLIVPIVHMDLVRVDGKIATVGSSSITIRVEAQRHDIHTRSFKRAAVSDITYVAIDPKTLRPNKNIPRLEISTEEEKLMQDEAKQRKALTAEWKQKQKELEEGPSLKVSDLVGDEFNGDKREHLSIAETEVVVRKQMLPRHNNHLNVIFGGDVLRWMLGVATYTAKRFSGNHNMIVVSMNRIDFKQSIKPEHVVEMHARVVNVRRYILEVEIETFVDKSFERQGILPAHAGYFTVLSLDELGFRRALVVGLKLNDDDQEGLKRYAKAKFRREFDQDVDTSRSRIKPEFWMQ